MIELVIQEITIDRISIDLFEANFQLIFIKTSETSELLQAWRRLEILQKVLLSMLDLADRFLVIEERDNFRCSDVFVEKYRLRSSSVFAL